MYTLEIACNQWTSCMHAMQAGAHRIELFENLADGGCTPSFGMIKAVMAIRTIPIYVMVRPRGGNFCYTKEEFQIMLSDVEQCKKLGVDGIVFGMLTPDGRVDIERCQELMQLWGQGSATFHRAIDRSRNLVEAVEDILQLGMERILTSGGKRNVLEGLSSIKELITKYGQAIRIMPGAGVLPSNLESILAETGATEIHATAKRIIPSPSFSPEFEDKITESSLEEIDLLVQALHHWEEKVNYTRRKNSTATDAKQ
jgi:copper homeostasis protein